MFSLDGRLYNIMMWIYRLFVLNLFYLISCIFVVTMPAATGALFGVVRKWVKDEDPPIFKTYLAMFVENWKTSTIIGFFVFILGILFTIDFYSLHTLKRTSGWFFSDALLVVGFIALITLLHVFPLMVHTTQNARQLVVNGFKLAIYRPHLTLMNVVGVGILIAFGMRFTWFLVFFYPSVAAYLTYWISNKKFVRLMPPAPTETDGDEAADLEEAGQ